MRFYLKFDFISVYKRMWC